MSQSADMLLLYVSVWGIFFAIGGLKLGDQMDEEDAKNSRIKKQRIINDKQNQENLAKQQTRDSEKAIVTQQQKRALIATLQHIGFEKIRSYSENDGRSWRCNSYWLNPVSNFESVIQTYKNASGNLQTDLNGNQLYIHHETSGGQQPVKSTHQKDMETLIKTVLVTKSSEFKNVKIQFKLEPTTVKGCHITFEL